jgi:hypothetical protein
MWELSTGTSNMETTKAETREQRFKRLVREHNEKTGFAFTLNELNPNDDYKYAHATHSDDQYRITCQLDTENDFVYGLSLELTDTVAYIAIEHDLTKTRMDEVIRSDAFRRRVSALTMLNDLETRIRDERQRLTDNLITDSITETELQDAYDTISTAARRLLRPS